MVLFSVKLFKMLQIKGHCLIVIFIVLIFSKLSTVNSAGRGEKRGIDVGCPGGVRLGCGGGGCGLKR